jgi:hypothetical protein
MKAPVSWDLLMLLLLVVVVAFEIEFCYVAQAGLQFAILIPPPPQPWDFRHVPPHPAVMWQLGNTPE